MRPVQTGLRGTARMLTGSTYALLGVDAVRAPGGRVELAAETLTALRRIAPLPADDELIVRGNAAVQTAAGVLLAFGRYPRLSAVALIASLVPTTMAGHAFWTIQDPTARKLQRIQFHKNVAMLGGLCFAILDQPTRRPAPTRRLWSNMLSPTAGGLSSPSFGPRNPGRRTARTTGRIGSLTLQRPG